MCLPLPSLCIVTRSPGPRPASQGLSNFGYNTGTYIGAFMLEALHVDEPDFENLTLYLGIRQGCRALVLLMIPFLVPAGTPSDTVDAMEHSSKRLSTHHEEIREESNRMKLEGTLSGAVKPRPHKLIRTNIIESLVGDKRIKTMSIRQTGKVGKVVSTSRQDAHRADGDAHAI